MGAVGNVQAMKAVFEFAVFEQQMYLGSSGISFLFLPCAKQHTCGGDHGAKKLGQPVPMLRWLVQVFKQAQCGSLQLHMSTVQQAWRHGVGAWCSVGEIVIVLGDCSW
jgi:hypothetical protein